LVTGGSTGYTLALAPERVDALAVAGLAETASAQRTAGDATGAARTCAAALALFSGDIPLPAAGDAGWVEPHRARLQELRLRLTEDHLAARLDAGASPAGDLIGELESMVAAHPLREGGWLLLITALYRAGRQADALAAYRRARDLLADELGLDPGPELRALEQRILRHDEALDAPVRGNLPGLSASLHGRAADLAALRDLVARHRLVTVAGPAGVGKTRLALEVARGIRRDGGSWLVRLEGASTGAAAWHEIGDALDVAAPTEPMVLDRLRGHDLLLVLDNCEQLAGELPAMVGRLLTAAPRVTVLATSQVPLGIDGETVHPLAPLSTVDSVALFIRRAGSQRRVDIVDTGAVEEVCRALDGLPLAIELAAARTRALSVPEIARRLSDRFTLLTDPTSHRPPRQRALSAAIAWSYDLLFADDQRGLWALACFVSGAPLTAVEHVLGALDVPSAAALDVVDRLVNRSLVAVDPAADGDVRYRLLDSVREYSLDRLRASGLADVALGAHAAWFAGAADRAAGEARGPDQTVHMALARAERANIDAALAWTATHDPGLGLRIATGFGWTWVVLGSGPTAAQRIRAALEAASAVATDADAAAALLPAGLLEASGGDLGRATADLDRVRRIAGDGGEVFHRWQLYSAFVCSQHNDPVAAQPLLVECREAFRALGRRWEEGASWVLSAWAETALGRIAAAKRACAESVRVLEPIGDAWILAHAEAMLGGLAQAEHRFADATVHLGRAADAAGRLGFASAEAFHLTNLGRARQQAGDHPGARSTFERAIGLALAAGDLRTAALARVRLARSLRALGDAAAARRIVAATRDWYAAAGGGDGVALAEYLDAALAADAGEPDAGARLTALAAAARERGDAEAELLALDVLARLAAAAGRTGEATTLARAADDLLPAARHLVADADRIDRA
jgi:predicted ATPase